MFHDVLSSPRTNYVIGGALTIGAILGLSGYFGHSMPTFGGGIAVFAVGSVLGALKINHHFKMKRLKKAFDEEKKRGGATAPYLPTPIANDPYVTGYRHPGKPVERANFDFNHIKPMQESTVIADAYVVAGDAEVRASATFGDYDKRMHHITNDHL